MLNFLLIGLGKMGIGYDLGKNNNFLPNQSMTHFRSIHDNPISNLVACVETDPEKIKKYKNLDIGNIYSNLNDAFLNHSIDNVVISSSTFSHLAVLEKLERHECQSILCEKPAGLALGSDLSKFSPDFLDKIYINYHRRSMPAFQSLKNFFSNNKLPTKGNIIYSGDFVSNCSHAIDLILWIFFKNNYSIINFDNENSFTLNIDKHSFSFQKNHSNSTILMLELWNDNCYCQITPDEVSIDIYSSTLNNLSENVYKKISSNPINYQNAQAFSLQSFLDISHQSKIQHLPSIKEAVMVNEIIFNIKGEK